MDSVQNDFHGKDINLITVGMSSAVDISLDTYRSEGRPVRRKLVSRCSTPAGSRVPHYKKKQTKISAMLLDNNIRGTVLWLFLAVQITPPTIRC